MTVLAAEDPPTLVAVFVDPVARGDGTAARLLQAVVDWARARGFARWTSTR